MPCARDGCLRGGDSRVMGMTRLLAPFPSVRRGTTRRGRRAGGAKRPSLAPPVRRASPASLRQRLPVRVNGALTRLVDALVGARAEEVVLRLRQVRREVRRIERE